MAKRGRKPTSDPRTERVGVYLTPKERDRLAKAAGSDSPQAIASYLRDSAFDRIAGRRSVPAVNEEAWVSLARTTANLNQLAWHANSGERVSGEDLLGVLVDLRDEVEALRAELKGEK